MNNALLHVHNLNIDCLNPFKNLLQEVSFSIFKKRNLAILGESGSGKTITGKAILGFLRPWLQISSGEIFFKGKDLRNLSPKEMHQLRGKEITTVLQNPMNALTPSMKIGNQLIETIIHHKKFSKTQALEYALYLLEEVNISNPQKCFNSYPFELSGGTLQRVVFAISISCSPSLIVADEPTTALDSISQSQVISLFNKIQKKYDSTMLLITHNIAIAIECCCDIVVMRNGKVIETGSAEQISKAPSHPYTQKLLHSIKKLPNHSVNYLDNPLTVV